MRKEYIIAALLVVAGVSCQRIAVVGDNEPVGTEDVQRPMRTFTCMIGQPSGNSDSKVNLLDDGKTEWASGDEIFIHGQKVGSNATYTYSTTVRLGDTGTSISADNKTATFTIPALDRPASYSSTYFAAYPASAIKDGYSVGDNWYYTMRFKNTNAQLLVGFNDTRVNDGNTFFFYNLCACVSFVVSGDFDSYVFTGNNGETVGYSTYQVRFNNNGGESNRKFAFIKGEDWCDDTAGPLTSIEVDGWTGADGTTVNKIFIPYEDGGVKTFPNGFTIKFMKDGDVVKQVSTSQNVVLSADAGDDYKPTYLRLGDVTDYLVTPPADHTDLSGGLDFSTATDLSSPESANCYVITAPGQYKFKAVKGNSSASVGSLGGSILAWETTNSTSAAPAVNTVIEAQDYYVDGDTKYIVFKTPDTLVPGNALIAATNASGVILWSWHIWIPKTTITMIDDSDFYAAEIMDRNLGALNAATSSDAGADTYGLYYQWGRKDPFLGSLKSVNHSSAAFDKVERTQSTAYTVLHPTVYVKGSENTGLGNWNTEDVLDLWDKDGKKTQYDPCPAGYRVPVATSTPMWTKSGTGWTFASGYDEYTSNGIVFPMTGYIQNSIDKVGSRTIVWSATYNSADRGWCMYLRETYNATNYYKYIGGSVRCVRK